MTENKKLYCLSDGREVVKFERFTNDEYEQACKKASAASDDNWTWYPTTEKELADFIASRDADPRLGRVWQSSEF
jgi:hypothetical protein